MSIPAPSAIHIPVPVGIHIPATAQGRHDYYL